MRSASFTPWRRKRVCAATPPSRFSFNVKGGRCEECAGQGKIRKEMSFLARRLRRLRSLQRRSASTKRRSSIRYNEKNIVDVFCMTVEEAVPFFHAFPKIARPLKVLDDIGMGYINLGQASNTLSGGEAQRIKLAYELGKESRGTTLYVLDEPTTGLHFLDVEKLIHILHRLVDMGNTVVTIEHNLDIVKDADYIVDLGPEGGAQGGQLVACGTPLEVIKDGKHSHTARFLREYLNGSAAPARKEIRAECTREFKVAARIFTMLAHGLRLRCPRCGTGRLYGKPFRMHDRCAHCTLKFEREQGYFIGAIYINYAATIAIAVPGFFLLDAFTHITINQQLALWIPFAVIFPLLFFHHSRSLVAGVRSLLQSGKAALQRAAEEKKRRVIMSVVRRRHSDYFVAAREIHSGE